MELYRFDNVQEFWHRTQDYLTEYQAEHNALLGVLHTLLHFPERYPELPYLALVQTSGNILAIAIRTPPNSLLLSKVQDLNALTLIAQDLHQEQLSGVSGLVAETGAFVQIWQSLTGHSYQRAVESRIYQLTHVEPVAAVNGYLRLATHRDRPLLFQWVAAFNSEIDIAADDEIERRVEVELKRQSTYLWEDGVPVSMVGGRQFSSTAARIAPVYTPYDHVQEFRDLHLTNRALADVSGIGGSSVGLRGQQITLDSGAAIFDGSRGIRSSGLISIRASQLDIEGTAPLPYQPSGVFTYTLGSQAGGNIDVDTSTLRLRQGGLVVTKSFSAGSAGDLNIMAPESVLLDGVSLTDLRVQSSLNSNSTSTGRTGNIYVRTGNLKISNGAAITTGVYGEGQGGIIQVDATRSVELDGVALQPSLLGSVTLGTGDAGAVIINAPALRVMNGGRIDSSTVNAGNAGSVFIQANQSITVSGTILGSQLPSGISSAAVRVDPLLQKLFPAAPNPSGEAGNIFIATNRLTVTDGGLVTVRNEGLGDAGQLTINAHAIRLHRGGGISASTNSGVGGNISINTKTLVLNNRSIITATAGGKEDGGNIRINSDVVALLKGSRISANAGQGVGGQIFVAAQGVFRSSDSSITATSALGPEFNGIVQITTPDIDLSRSGIQAISPLATPEVAVTCGGGSAANANSFTISGMGGIPINPDEFLGSQRGWRDPEQTQSQSSTKPSGSPQAIVEAQGWERTSANTVRFAVTTSMSGSHYFNASTGCVNR